MVNGIQNPGNLGIYCYSGLRRNAQGFAIQNCGPLPFQNPGSAPHL